MLVKNTNKGTGNTPTRGVESQQGAWNLFKNMGMIEKYGSGIRRIIDQFHEMKLQSPNFENLGAGFLVTAHGVKDVVKDAVKLNGRQLKILSLIRSTPHISAEELASEIGINKRNAQLNTCLCW